MSKKMIAGLGVLIFLICTAFVFMTIQNRAQMQQLKDEVAEAEKLEQSVTEHPTAENKPPRAAKEGNKWEWHDDHWHETPVDKLNSDLDLTDEKPDLQTTSLTPIQVDLKSLREKMTALDKELLAEDLAKHQKRVEQ